MTTTEICFFYAVLKRQFTYLHITKPQLITAAAAYFSNLSTSQEQRRKIQAMSSSANITAQQDQTGAVQATGSWGFMLK